MKNATLKVLINWKNITNKSGLYLVYLRITIERKARFLKIPNLPKFELKDFNQNNVSEGFISTTHPLADYANENILKFKNEVSSIIYHLIENRKEVSHTNIKNNLKHN